MKIDREFLNDPPRDPQSWTEIWERDLEFPIASHRGPLGWAVVFAKRLLRPLFKTPLNDLYDRQRAFNLVQLDYVRRLLGLEGKVQDELAAMRERVLPAAVKRSDALYAMLDIKLEEALGKLRTLEPLLDADRADLRRALAALEAGALTGSGADSANIAKAALERVADRLGERRYFQFEDSFRGTSREIAERLARYVARFEGAPGVVIDLGCGRGEFLTLLEQHGLRARGVDGNDSMVESCRERGLDVERGDLFGFLERQSPESLGGVVAFQVIEHIGRADLERLLRGAWRALASGGHLLLETPNPLSLKVGASNFYLDPTHQNPVHPEALAFTARQLGFDEVEILQVNPFALADLLPDLDLPPNPPELRAVAAKLNDLIDRLNGILYGHQDYALIARKP